MRLESKTATTFLRPFFDSFLFEDLIKPSEEEFHRTDEQTRASPSEMDPNFDLESGSFKPDFENSRGSMSYRSEGYPLVSDAKKINH